MISTASTPGLYFTVAPRQNEASPLRTDVAGFVGRTRRGKVGIPIRVEEWRGYLREFGGLSADSSTTYAIRGYFENGGQVAYVVRLYESVSENAGVASAIWQVGKLDETTKKWTADSPAAFKFAEYFVEATSPGTWGNDVIVRFRFRKKGPRQDPKEKPEVDINVTARGEAPEYFAGVPLCKIESTIAKRSLLIRIRPNPNTESADSDLEAGPNHLEWELKLSKGNDGGKVRPPHYLDAIDKLGGENRQTVTDESLTDPSVEAALLAVPGLYEDIDDSNDQREVVLRLLDQAERLHDRLVVLDLPTQRSAAEESGLIDGSFEWFEDIQKNEPMRLRSAAVYHPSVRVPDPLGGVARPVRCVPPSGHVAGLISRLDRERGPHHTPANATLFDAVDTTRSYDQRKQAQFQDAGVNLIRCFPGRGLVVWGGRTLDARREYQFIAHRRLIHQLVRAIRRVADPLVFDPNTPELRLKIMRAITTVLLEAWRTGALKGNRPEEAFRVACDDQTTPPEEQDLGRVICEIEVAPAVPMEFILLRVALGAEGKLEVFE